jgi:phosphoenolpyruvate phosphomutase
MSARGDVVRSASQTLSAMLREPEPFCFVGVYDALSAHLAQGAGAPALWASGLCMATALGLQDNEILTYDAALDRLGQIRRATTVPILADGNAGFGGEDVVAYVTQRAEMLGINGICLEDKAYPRRNSFADQPPEIASIEDFGVKLDAAAAARRSRDFLIVARAEGLLAGLSPGEVLVRSNLYLSAGADAVVVHSKSTTADEVVHFARLWSERAPLIVIPTTYPSLSMSAAAQAGISAVIYANQLMRAAIYAIEDILDEVIQAESLSECTTCMASVHHLLALMEGEERDRRATREQFRESFRDRLAEASRTNGSGSEAEEASFKAEASTRQI